jgi:hypothetical protein
VAGINKIGLLLSARGWGARPATDDVRHVNLEKADSKAGNLARLGDGPHGSKHVAAAAARRFVRKSPRLKK